MSGELTMSIGETHLNLKVRVVRAEGREAGLSFVIWSDQVSVGRQFDVQGIRTY
jgi:hypothetical protein